MSDSDTKNVSTKAPLKPSDINIKKSNILSFMYTNTDVLNNKLTELEATASSHNIDVICINETMPKKMNDKNTTADVF